MSEFRVGQVVRATIGILAVATEETRKYSGYWRALNREEVGPEWIPRPSDEEIEQLAERIHKKQQVSASKVALGELKAYFKRRMELPL